MKSDARGAEPGARSRSRSIKAILRDVREPVTDFSDSGGLYPETVRRIAELDEKGRSALKNRLLQMRDAPRWDAAFELICPPEEMLREARLLSARKLLELYRLCGDVMAIRRIAEFFDAERASSLAVREAVLALAAIDHDEARAAIARALGSPSTPVREEARRALDRS